MPGTGSLGLLAGEGVRLVRMWLVIGLFALYLLGFFIFMFGKDVPFRRIGKLSPCKISRIIMSEKPLRSPSVDCVWRIFFPPTDSECVCAVSMWLVLGMSVAYPLRSSSVQSVACEFFMLLASG